MSIGDFDCHTFGQIVIITDEKRRLAAVGVVATGAGQNNNGHGMIYEIAGSATPVGRRAKYLAKMAGK